jgi:hypothetical protein
MDDFCHGRFDVKFLLGLALAATASATAAQAKTPIPIAVPDYERIIEAAIVICPAAFRVSERASEYIQREARARGLNREELLVLLSHCRLYGEGWIAGRTG